LKTTQSIYILDQGDELIRYSHVRLSVRLSVSMQTSLTILKLS